MVTFETEITCLKNLSTMETKNRIVYEAPTAEIVELKFDGILCFSDQASASMNGTFTEETI
jgi:hypothetical protein